MLSILPIAYQATRRTALLATFLAALLSAPTALVPISLVPTALAQSDLSIGLQGVPATEIRGGNFNAQYVLSNLGPDDANGPVVLTVTLDNATLESLSGGGLGTVNLTSDTEGTVTFPSVQFGLTITNAFQVRTNGSGGDATVTVSVAFSGDPNAANNTASAVVSVPLRPEGDIEGTVLVDANKDGAVDAGDTPLEGVRIDLVNGTFRTTDAEGRFEWRDLFRRPYDMTVNLPENHTLVLPATNPFSVNVEDGQVTTVVILLDDGEIVSPARVSGRLGIFRSFSDQDSPMVGVRVYNDANDSGTFEEAELSTLTDADGRYAFSGLIPPQTLRLRTLHPAFAKPVDPEVPMREVALTSGSDVTADFSFRFSGVIEGFMYVDHNANGVYDGNDGDSQLEEGEDEAAPDLVDRVLLFEGGVERPDAQNSGDPLVGQIIFGNLLPATYNIDANVPAGWEVSESFPDVVVNETTPFPERHDIGAFQRVTIRGTAFFDLNQNGALDAGEPPAKGISLACTSGGDCNGQTDVSDAQGVFLFADVEPGSFTLDITAPEGPAQIVAPAGGQFQFFLPSGVDNSELLIAIKEPQTGLQLADMTIEKTVTPAFPAPGDPVTFSLLVINRGQDVALEVISRDRLLSMDFVSATATQGTCDFQESTGEITCFHQSIEPGDTVRADIQTTAGVSGPRTNVATVTTTSTEVTDGNNSATVEFQVSDVVITATAELAEHQTCTPGWDFMPAEDTNGLVRRTTDNNLIQLGARFFNEDPNRTEVITVSVIMPAETPPDGLLPEPQTLSIPPQDSRTVHFTIDTDGLAWQPNGQPRTDPYPFVMEARRGEALVADVIQRIRVLPRPLVLVHGLWSNAATWDLYEGFATAAHPGWEGRVFAVDVMDTGVAFASLSGLAGVAFTGGFPPETFTTTSIAENAGRLDGFIDLVREETNSCHFDLVAHSMGGLISREYIHSLMPPAEPDAETRVQSLSMLGTPNEGSPCTDQVLDLYMRQKAAENADPDFDASQALPFPRNVIELSKSFAVGFNQRVTDKKGLLYNIVAGNHLDNTCTVLSQGDLVVELESAIALNVPGLIFQQVFTDVLHTGMTLDGRIFREAVVPWVRQARGNSAAGSSPAEAPYVPPGTSSRVAGASSSTGAAHASSSHGPVEALTRFVSLADGDVEFPISTASVLSVMVMTAPEVGIALLDPSGATVDEAPAVLPDSAGFFRTLIAETPATGTWRLRFTNTGSEADADLGAAVTLSLTDPAFNIEPVFGEPMADIVPVEAVVTVDGLPAAATVRVDALGGDGSAVVTAPLFDDGLHGDGAAGDGRYAGDIATGAPGDVLLVVRAEREGKARSAQTIVNIATVTDVERAPGEQPTHFRLADVYPNPIRNRATIELDVPEAGHVRIRLLNALGQEAGSLLDRTLQPGTFRITLDATHLGLAPGVYVVAVEAGRHQTSRSVVVF